MRPIHWILCMLLRIYPAPWRREYGAELAHVLRERPLTAMTIADLVLNGVRQRIRDAEPAVLIGVAMMLFVCAGIVSNVAALTSARGVFGRVLQDSSMTLPGITVAAFETNLYALTLMLCGCWTHLRNGGRPSASAMAAVRLGALAGIPVMVVGLLMLIGVVHVRVIGSGNPLPYPESVWTYTYFSAQLSAPSWIAVCAAPLLRLPQAWIYGWIGGRMGRVIARWRERTLVNAGS